MAITSISPESDSLAARLQTRSLQAAGWKQRALHACRHLPPSLQKPLRKSLWPPPFRHMRYVLPSVALQPADCGVWNLRPRDGSGTEFVSCPLADLRDSTGQPAIVIATGPTAKDFDWPSLADGRRLIWAVNGAPTLLAKHGLHCDFLVITDHRFARDGADHIELAVEQGAALLFSYEAAAGFAATRPGVLSRAPFHVFEKANAWFGLPAVGAAELARLNTASGEPFVLPKQPALGVGWSHDPELGVFAGRTVAFAALQLVVWSGSREIEIVGLDLGGKTRAYEEANPVVSHLEKDLRDFILPSFQCMAAALAGRSIRITNLSKTSPLPRKLVPETSEPP